jgi:hypothetical protein
MQTVIETPAFLASVDDEGISATERAEIVSFMAANPSAGDMIIGSGGARKVRFAGRGKGKSGGYRVITFFADKDIPVFLLDVYSKDSQTNLSKAERNELRKILTELPRVWRENVRAKVEKLRRRS